MDGPEFKISVSSNKDNSEEHSEVIISGDLSINNCNSIYNKILNDLLPAESVQLKVIEPVNMDLSFLQILISFVITRKQRNYKTNVILELDNTNTELLTKTGMAETIEILQK